MTASTSPAAIARSLSDGWAVGPLLPPGPVFFPSLGNGVAVAILVALVAAAARHRREAWALRARERTLVLLALPAAAAVASVAAYARSAPGGAAPHVLAWELSLASMVGIAILHWPERPPREPAARRKRAVLLGAVLGLSSIVRIAWLASTPARIQTEEVTMGLWYRLPMEGRVPELFGVGFVKLPLLHFAARGLLATLLGEGLLGMRLVTAAISMATIWLLFRLVELLEEDVVAAAAAATFLSFHHAFLFWSRTGYHHVDGALVMVATLLLLLEGMRAGAWPLALLAGSTCGVLVQGYFSARAAPVVAGLLYLCFAIPRRGRALALRSAAAFAFALVMACAPQIWVYLRDPSALSAREEHGATLSVRELGTRAGIGKLGRAVAETVVSHTIGATGDPNYGAVPDPYLHVAWRPLVILGALALLRRRRRHTLGVAALSLGATLLLGAVLVQPSRERRTFPALPGIAILAGAAVAEGARRSRSVVGSLPVAATVGLLAVGVADQSHLVLVRQPRLKPSDLPSAAARYLASDSGDVQILASPALREGDPHVELLAPDAPARYVDRLEDLRAGAVIWSAWHRAFLEEVGRLPGVEVSEPWGKAPPPASSLPGTVTVRLMPPALVRLPSPLADLAAPAWRLRVHGGGRLVRDEELCFPHVDLGVGAGPEKQATLETTVTGPGAVRVSARARGGAVTLLLDGRVVRAGAPVALSPGAHRLEARISRQRVTTTMQLSVSPGEGARCCTLPGGVPARRPRTPSPDFFTRGAPVASERHWPTAPAGRIRLRGPAPRASAPAG